MNIFKLIAQLANMLCRTVNAADLLVEAVEIQAEHIRNLSRDDVDTKREARQAERKAAIAATELSS